MFINELVTSSFDFFIDAHVGSVATSGVIFWVLPTTREMRIPSVNVEMTERTTAMFIL